MITNEKKEEIIEEYSSELLTVVEQAFIVFLLHKEGDTLKLTKLMRQVRKSSLRKIISRPINNLIESESLCNQ